MTDDIEIRRDVPYGGGPDGDLTLDLYLPAAAGPHPAVICLHGGAWCEGTKAVYRGWGPWLARAGYAAVAVDYRLSTPTRSTWPGVLDDARTALDWLTARAATLRVDPGRTAAMGDSAGAHLAALLALGGATRGRLSAVVGVYGVYDLADLAEWWHRSRRALHGDPAGDLIGGSPVDRPEAYAAASPLVLAWRLSAQGVRPETAWFLAWGEADELVPPAQSWEFVVALDQLGLPVETAAVPDFGHFWFTLQEEFPGRDVTEEPNATLAPRILRFLDTHVRQAVGNRQPIAL